MRGQQYRGPGPNNTPVLTMDNTPVNGQALKDTLGYRLYDTYRVKAGTAVSLSQFLFFQVPQGQQQAGQNFATQYSKTLIDTNMESAGQLQKGRFFVVTSIQCRVIMTGATDTTYGSSGPGTEMPTDPTGAASVGAANLEKAILEAGFMTFKIDNREYEQGKMIHFPSPYGISGFAGAGVSTTDAVAIANNGFGRPYRLPIERRIDGLRNFNVAAQFAYAFTPQRNFNIEVCLEGTLYRSVI